jgi:hypothetical protein
VISIPFIALGNFILLLILRVFILVLSKLVGLNVPLFIVIGVYSNRLKVSEGIRQAGVRVSVRKALCSRSDLLESGGLISMQTSAPSPSPLLSFSPLHILHSSREVEEYFGAAASAY